MSLPPYPIPVGVETPCMADAELMFPNPRDAPVKMARAKKVCDPCPYRDGCLKWALTRGEEGVWAGTDEEERKALCEARGIVPERPINGFPRGIRNAIPHGTPVGVEAHRKRYQPLCDECVVFDENRKSRRAS